MSNPLLKRFLYLCVGVAVAGLGLWVLYFDSHNLMDRWAWQQEYEMLQERNDALRADIEDLEQRLESPPPDSLIERVAREEYGMSKPGEIIYRLPPADQ